MNRRYLMSGAAALAALPGQCPAETPRKLETTTLAGSNLVFSDFNISADGETVLFEVAGGAGRHTLGLYDWRRDRVRRIPNPPDGTLSSGSFSSDGNLLCATKTSRIGGMLYTNIVRINLHSFEVTDITRQLAAASFVSYPVFQPDTNNILFCRYDDPNATGLNLATSEFGQIESVLDRQRGFLRIFRPSFTANDKVLFPGICPFDKELKRNLDPRLFGGEQCYTVQFGGNPAMLFPKIEAAVPRPGAGYTSISCSRNAGQIVAIGVNMDEPHGRSGEFNYEIFRLSQDGHPSQITDLKGHLGLCRVAYFGNVACFGSRDARGAPTDLNIIDLQTHSVIRTGLRQNIEN